MNFEQSINKIDEIIEKISSGEVSLDESVKLFSEGVKLVDKCNESLKKAELKIEELSSPKEA